MRRGGEEAGGATARWRGGGGRGRNSSDMLERRMQGARLGCTGKEREERDMEIERRDEEDEEQSKLGLFEHNLTVKAL